MAVFANDIEKFVSLFILFFVLMDPISTAPLYAVITSHLKQPERIFVAFWGPVIGFGILFFFWLFGSILFKYLGISINSFEIIGGIFLIILAIDMVFGKEDRKSSEKALLDPQDKSRVFSLAVFPAAIPLIAGPGAVTLMILHPVHQADGFLAVGACFIVIVINIIVFRVFIGKIDRINPAFTLAFQKVAGLLLGALAIEFVLAGIDGHFGL